MLLRKLRTKDVLEVVHHALDICLGAPCQNIVVSIGLFDMLKVSS